MVPIGLLVDQHRASFAWYRSVYLEAIVKIEGSVALVTGANRGLGRALAQELLKRGATKVYAAVRDPRSVTDPGVTPIQLDVTRPEQIAAAAAQAGDVTLVINNAGISSGGTTGSSAATRADFEVNVFGTAEVSRVFAPVLAANGGGAILNVLSALSFLSMPSAAGYSASKAAAWSLTNALRLQLLEQGTQVVALHVGFMDTDMIAKLDVAKVDPVEVATAALDGIEAGAHEVLADETSRNVKGGLSADLSVLYPALAA
jgi:NAD(P)-dependent dehydrogenase (short-subunit alcohol dehydrogenase family)